MRLATRTALAAFVAATLSLLVIGVVFQLVFTRILFDRVDTQLEERADVAPILAAIAELDDHKRALIARVMEEERQLTERTDRYWREIDRENDRFDTRDKLVQAIRDASVASLAASELADVRSGE